MKDVEEESSLKRLAISIDCKSCGVKSGQDKRKGGSNPGKSLHLKQ